MSIEIKKLSENDTGKEFYDMLQTIEAEHAYMHGMLGKPYEVFPRWLAHCVKTAEGNVRASSKYWFLKDGTPIGIGCFQHELTDAFRESGGNIVYCIAPQYRGNGYGAEAVRLLIEQMRAFGISEILFMIKKNNTPSLRCAEKCGAKKTSENEEEYFLTVKQPKGSPTERLPAKEKLEVK